MLTRAIRGKAAQANPDWNRERAVRKVVRCIIEGNGGNGPEVKTDMDISYRRGVVWFKDERIAEWQVDADSMKFSEVGKTYEEAFKKIIVQK